MKKLSKRTETTRKWELNACWTFPELKLMYLGKGPLFQNGKMISAVSIDSGLVAEDGKGERGKACSSAESFLLMEEAAVDSSGDTHFHIT